MKLQYIFIQQNLSVNLLLNQILCVKINYVGHALGLYDFFKIILSKNYLKI